MPQQPVNFYIGFQKGMIVLWDTIFSSHQIRLFEIASLDVKFPSWVDLHLWDSVQPASRVEMEHNKSAPSPFLSTQLHNSFFAWYPWPLFLQLISLHPGGSLHVQYLLLGPDLASWHTLLLPRFFLEPHAIKDPGSKLFLIIWPQLLYLQGGLFVVFTRKYMFRLKWMKTDSSISGVPLWPNISVILSWISSEGSEEWLATEAIWLCVPVSWEMLLYRSCGFSPFPLRQHCFGPMALSPSADT